jgi:hypothetical protein
MEVEAAKLLKHKFCGPNAENPAGVSGSKPNVQPGLLFKWASVAKIGIRT